MKIFKSSIIEDLKEIALESKMNDLGKIINPYEQIWIVDKDLESYSKDLNFDIKKYVFRKIKNKPFIILDLGCGIGTMLKEVEDLHSKIYGFGITNHVFDFPDNTKIHNNERIIHGNIFSYRPNYVISKIPNNSIDLVLSDAAIGYNDPSYFPELFSEIKRILKRNGLATIDMMSHFPKIRLDIDQNEILNQYNITPHNKTKTFPSQIIQIHK